MSRKPLDHYTEYIATTYLTREMMARVPEIRGTILEPCAGEGFMADALAEFARVEVVKTNDIDPQYKTDFVDDACFPGAICWDLLEDQRGGVERYDCAVTNPPYICAHDILTLALRKVNVGVAFLLRQTYDEPTLERYEWLEEHKDCMRYRIPVNPRPKWRKGTNPKTGKPYSNDSVTNTWFVWLKHFSWKRDFGIESPFQFIHGWRPDKEALDNEL